MRSLPGLTLQATTAREDPTTNVYRLDLDTQFDRTTGVVRLSNRRHRRGRARSSSSGKSCSTACSAASTNLGATFGSATDYDEYHGLGLACSGRRRRYGRRTLVQRLSLALGSARARRSRRRLPARSRLDLVRAAAPGFERANLVARGRARRRRSRDPALGRAPARRAAAHAVGQPALELAPRARRAVLRGPGRSERPRRVGAAASPRSTSKKIRVARISR